MLSSLKKKSSLNLGHPCAKWTCSVIIASPRVPGYEPAPSWNPILFSHCCLSTTRSSSCHWQWIGGIDLKLVSHFDWFSWRQHLPWSVGRWMYKNKVLILPDSDFLVAETPVRPPLSLSVPNDRTKDIVKLQHVNLESIQQVLSYLGCLRLQTKNYSRKFVAFLCTMFSTHMF